MIFADARPDGASISTDSRMEKAVVIGLRFIQSLLSPYAVITQGESSEDAFFWNTVSKYLRDAEISHISLPTASTNVMWVSALNSSALAGMGILGLSLSAYWLADSFDYYHSLE